MNYKPGFFGRLLTGSGDWGLSIGRDILTWKGENAFESKSKLPSIKRIETNKGILWSTVLITINGKTLSCRGLSGRSAVNLHNHLRKAVSQSLSRQFFPSQNLLTVIIQELNKFYRRSRYLSNRDVALWSQTVGSGDHLKVRELIDTLQHPFFDRKALGNLRKDVRHLLDLLAGKREELARRNERFVAEEMERLKAYFASVESQPLTIEQQKAAIVLEDRNLLIAAAGSGKSSTLIAKVGYALEAGYCSPDQILTLAFNKTAAQELDSRITERLSAQVKDQGAVFSCTFHRLGLDIIAAVEGKKPDLAPWAAETQEGKGKLIEGIVHRLAQSDRGFFDRWARFQTICFRPNKELTQFKTLREYNVYLRQVGEERGGHRGIRTLNGELVKSMEEVAIANWLFMKGIPYEYERPYEYQTADRQHRQYHPDFYFPDITCYHEHFALDDNGKTPAIFKGEYEEGVRWKRMIHAERQTALIESTSAMYRNGSLFPHLEAELKNRGQVFREKKPEEISEILNGLRLPSYYAFISTFITLCKSGGFAPASLRKKAALLRDSYRAVAFLEVVIPIFHEYEEMLKSKNCIDFEDMIQTATRYVRKGLFVHPYQLILVDEFQDIAPGRAELVKAMLKQSPDCRLFAVGDDWQSIYRFTGSEIGFMTAFPSHFGQTATNYLKKTFRSNQGITDAAARFVQANPTQIRKTVVADDKTREGTIQILEYRTDREIEGILSDELDILTSIARSEKRVMNVFLLGRYNFLRPSSLTSWKRRHNGALDINFLSLHRSKGLEADFVFILGLNSGSYSFPSEIADDPLLDLVLPIPEEYEYPEERRLFYVGLTRAKRRTYILTDKNKISRFIHELLTPENKDTVIYRSAKMAEGHPDAEPCPSCGSGVLRVISGRYGPFMACSNFPDCTAKREVRMAPGPRKEAIY